MKLSVLEQCIAIAGRPHEDSIRQAIDLAPICEGLGYHRFWLAEHHNHGTIVGTAPEILMAAVAMRTERIRIGSAGIMLPHYAPLKVAEQFRVLEALAPGRIDLGLGRAPGSDGKTAYALNPNAPLDAEHFPANVRDLIAWVHGEPLIDGHPYADIRAHPQTTTAPEVWMLGSSNFGAELAAYLGMPYCFAYFITDGRGTEEALKVYRDNYRPSERHPEPEVNICVWALAADTEEEARHLFQSRILWRARRDRGIFQGLEAPDDAAADPLYQSELGRLQKFCDRALVGTPDHVAGRLREIAESLGIDELVILTWTHDPKARRQSYKLLAKEFELVS
ncbi:MAG: LLM class flavin-dependent oxidoreductase [Rhodospirillales bacterium]